jgi:hypothetical protein
MDRHFKLTLIALASPGKPAKPMAMRTTALTLLALSGLLLASCASDRSEKADYEERQQIRHQGQNEANHAADQGRSDLDRATAK